jgi:hypothetical protein
VIVAKGYPHTPWSDLVWWWESPLFDWGGPTWGAVIVGAIVIAAIVIAAVKR